MTEGTASRYEVFRDDAGEWRWRLRAGNGEIVGVSGEGYTREFDAGRAALSNAEAAIAAINDFHIVTVKEEGETK